MTRRANTLLYIAALSSCILISACKDKSSSQKPAMETQKNSISQDSLQKGKEEKLS